MLACLLVNGAAAQLALDHQRDALSLGGTWEVLREHEGDSVWDPAINAGLGPWVEVNVPSGGLARPADLAGETLGDLHKRTRCVWVRRQVEIPDAQSGKDAVLKWGGIRFGATAWINGKRIISHTPVGPATALIPRGTLRPGANEIVLKIPGWAGMPMSASGYPLTPTGGATQSWGGKGPAIYQDIWLEFYEGVYARWVLAMPDVSGKKITFRVWLDGAELRGKEIDLRAAVRASAGGEALAGQTARIVAPVDAIPPVDITCAFESFEPWTPATPTLYEAEIEVKSEGKTCDVMRMPFGMRQVTVEQGHFSLNGQPLWLRGSNLVNEWLWGDKFNENCKQYIVDEARVMNLWVGVGSDRSTGLMINMLYPAEWSC